LAKREGERVSKERGRERVRRTKGGRE